MCNNKQQIIILKILYIFTIYFTILKILNVPLHTLGKIIIQGPPCCLDENIITRNGCKNNNTNILLQCEYGKYLIDSKLEQFEISEDGNLFIYSDDTSITIDRELYCSTYLLYNTSTNVLRKAAMVCFQTVKNTWIIFLIKGTLSFISVIFLLITIFVYWFIPDLRETQDKVTCFTLICLTIFFTFLGINQLNDPHTLSIACVPIAFLVYFFSIAYFTWLNLIMVNVWKSSIKPKWKIKEKQWYRFNHLFGWTIPATLSLILYTAHNSENGLEPGFGEMSCWFQKKYETWVFLYLPISIILMINLILVIWSAYGLHQHGNDISLDKKNALTYKCKLYLKLFLLAGLTWIGEVISYHYSSMHDDSKWYWLILDSINALHGVLIFFVLIVSRRRIRRALAGRQILCLTIPEKWADVKIVEEESLNNGIEDNTKDELILK